MLLLVLAFAGYGVVEYAIHRRRLARIAVRVQVNGTRGKSSVTRLIAAGLRAGGRRVVAKTTGTTPRLILGDAEERPVRRLGKPNIAEQLRMALWAERHAADAIVFENMSLDPQYQRVESGMLIRPTHYVVTNVRADHLDVMGPTTADVGRTFRQAMPRRTRLFTAEQALRRTLEGRAETTVVADPAAVVEEEMAGFDHVEHRENVALALAVCADVGVDRQAALAGMKRTLPDPGALRVHRLRHAGRELELVNALAANDPDSIGMIWQLVAGRRERRLVLVNCRKDRQERSRQMAELVRGFTADTFIATGGDTRVFLHRARQLGIPADSLVDLGDERPPVEVFERVFALAREPALLFCCGNTVGYGEELVACFVERGGARGH
ncbi:MAG: poly-gamma-glutamate synthase PgsB [bacterium]